MPTTELTTRKSISMPRDLAAVIEQHAQSEHRSFTKQVTKVLSDFFASEGVIHLTPTPHDADR
jgi:hypothetical protein